MLTVSVAVWVVFHGLCRLYPTECQSLMGYAVVISSGIWKVSNIKSITRAMMAASLVAYG
ncbi:hypothetical protein DPMN_115507 [Dreissena polymorpha]|uniref:Uncharacterized protein n=1 Tax=Dreissena polymorpha TaxID=45954 RepID=A0A9D4KM33_DREPO|nr:hypothetical protein DPMN_115507 [Dreissena polymorpha]